MKSAIQYSTDISDPLFRPRRIKIQTDHHVVADQVVGFSGVEYPEILAIDRELGIDRNRFGCDIDRGWECDRFPYATQLKSARDRVIVCSFFRILNDLR